MATNYVIYMIIFACSLSHARAIRATGSKDDVVFTDIGIKIEKIGKSVSSENEILVSVIVQFPNMSMIGDINTAYNSSLVRRMADKCSSLKFYRRVWRENNEYFRVRAQNFLKSRRTLLEPFVTPLKKKSEEIPERPKRGLLGFLGSLGLTLFMGGVTEAQIYRLNKHVDQNSRAIDLLRHGILLQQTEIENLSENVVGFMREISTRLWIVLDREETCSAFYNVWSAKLRQDFIDWSKEIDDTLWTAIKGENSLLLTPRMLNLEMLRTIVQRNKALQNTIFEKNPSFLYSLAKMSLVEIEENLQFAHFVLMIPSVTEQDTVDVFRVSQVGAHLSGDMCLFHQLPDFLYKKRGQEEFWPMSLDRCKQHNALYVCPYEDFSNETSCIQESFNKCPMKRQHCPLNYQFIMSQIGILLRNNIKEQTFSSDLLGITSNVKLSKFGTAYLYWKGLSSVQISNKKIVSPHMEHVDIKMSNISPDIQGLMHYLSNDNVTNVFKDICNKYNKSLAEVVTPAFESFLIDNKKGNSTNWTTLITLIVCLLGISLWLGYLHYCIYSIQKLEKFEWGEGEELIESVDLHLTRRSSV